MKIVNKSGVPETVFKYLSQSFYDYDNAKNTVSATTLLKPIQQIVLEQRHDTEIEVDCLDSMWSLFGSGVHAVLEKIEGDVPIRRMYHEMDGTKVSGKFDLIKDNKIQDYKVTSAWTLVFGSRKSEWRRQLSIYRWLYWKETGFELDPVGHIIAILRDWSDKNINSTNYPKTPIVEIPLKLSSFKLTETFVRAKIKAIKEAKEMPDTMLPNCTNEERWWNEKQKKFNKCARYCNASKFCIQHLGNV